MASVLTTVASYLNSSSVFLQLMKNGHFQNITAAIDDDGFSTFLHRLLYNHVLESSKLCMIKFLKNKEYQKLLLDTSLESPDKEILYLSKYLKMTYDDSAGSLIPIQFKFDEGVYTKFAKTLYMESKVTTYTNGNDLITKILKSITLTISAVISTILSSLSSPDTSGNISQSTIGIVTRVLQGVSDIYDLPYFSPDNSGSNSDSNSDSDSDPPKQSNKRNIDDVDKGSLDNPPPKKPRT